MGGCSDAQYDIHYGQTYLRQSPKFCEFARNRGFPLLHERYYYPSLGFEGRNHEITLFPIKLIRLKAILRVINSLISENMVLPDTSNRLLTLCQ